MKQVLFLLIFIIWGVLQARRKALREKARLKNRVANTDRPEQLRQAASSEPLGAVTAEENRSDVPKAMTAREFAPREFTAKEFASREFTPEGAPEQVRSLIESRKKTKRRKERPQERPQGNEERVEEIVSPASESAYETANVAPRRVPIGTEALRTFMVTREILGPPRSKRPHRPEFRNR